jgi:hypothetical protein
MLNDLPAGVRLRVPPPAYHLPWLCDYVRRLTDEAHQPFGLSPRRDAAPGAQEGAYEHAAVVSQWSELFEAALKRQLSEDRFDNVNLQM